MKLHTAPPVLLEIGGKTYCMRPTVYNVMSAMEAMQDSELLPHDRIRLAANLLFDKPPKDAQAAVEAVFKAINEPSPYRVPDKGVRALDYEQDANLIIAAFRQLYGIDIQRESTRMDWRTFRALMGGITADTALGQIMDIRTRELPPANKHNSEQRRDMMRLKAEYAVRLRPEEQGKNYSDGLQNFARMLMQMAGDKNAGRKGRD
jgi:hypothetical protein